MTQQRYQTTKTIAGHVVIDTSNGRTIAGPFGPSRARREAQWYNHSQPDRDEWNSREWQPRYIAPGDTVSRIVFRDSRAVWVNRGAYFAMPLPVNR